MPSCTGGVPVDDEEEAGAGPGVVQLRADLLQQAQAGDGGHGVPYGYEEGSWIFRRGGAFVDTWINKEGGPWRLGLAWWKIRFQNVMCFVGVCISMPVGSVAI